MDEADKKQAQEQAAVREQIEAEAGDATMSEPEAPKAPAEVFSVDGSEQLQREKEAEAQAQRDAEAGDTTTKEAEAESQRAAEAENETMEPRVVGTAPPTEVFKDKPGDFPEQEMMSQPGKGIKGEKRMDDSGEEEKDNLGEEEKEPEPPPKKQAIDPIDPRINESTENFSKPGNRISYKDHPYTEKQAAEILKGEGGADVAFDDI